MAKKKSILEQVKAGTYEVCDIKKATKTYDYPGWMIMLANTLDISDTQRSTKQLVEDHLEMETLRLRAMRRK